jgi:hypothetical protein
VSAGFADLGAQIDPAGAGTRYHFEYDTLPYAEGEGGHGVGVPVPDAMLGSGGPTGGDGVGIEMPLSGLTADTGYYYRVVAENECEPGKSCVAEDTPALAGKPEGFVTLAEPEQALPDHRGYELVTPVSRQGGSDMFAESETNGEYFNDADLKSVGAPSRSGEGFVLTSESAFGAFPFAFGGEYAFTRELTRNQWSFTSLAVPSLGTQLPVDGMIADPVDLSRVAFNDGIGSQVSEEGERLTSLIGPPGAPTICRGPVSLQAAVAAGCDIRLHQDPLVPVNYTTGTRFVGGSRDLRHVVLESSQRSLCAGAEHVTHGNELCEWAGGYESGEGGLRPALLLVNVGDDGKAISECGAALGNAFEPPGKGLTFRAVSGDGQRVLLTAPDPRGANAKGTEGCWNRPEEEKTGVPRNPPQLYASVREAEPLGEVVHDTVKVSAPAEGVGTPKEYPAAYVGASEDGSRVFFVSEAWLTADHPEAHDRELYECQLTTVTVEEKPRPKCALTRVSIPVSEAGEPEPKGGSGVDFVPAVSANGSAVYFSATGVLAEGAAHGGINVYRYDTGSDTTSYVATVNGADYNGQPTCINELAEVGTGPCTKANWYATPDGGYLLFSDSVPTDGYNSGPQTSCTEPLPFTEALGDGRCSELYRYDAAAAGNGEQPVVCVSCGPGNEDYEGNAEFTRSASYQAASGPVQAMSDDGSYVFFDTSEALVPQATNGTLDTYEWHEDALTREDTLSLIGSGTDAFPSYFLGSSPYSLPDGTKVEAGNVFLGTHAQLVPQDTNTVGNIYDARICEALSPCIVPPTGGTGQCEGGSCQGASVAPLFQTPVTLAAGASGNIQPEPPKSVKPATQIRAQKLAAALKVCRKDRVRLRRVACEALARRRYGPAKKAKAKKASNDRRSK